MNQLPSFEPIEQLFPQWLTARTIVEHTLPRALRFERAEDNALRINRDWVQVIFDLTPLEDRDAVLNRIQAAWDHACGVIDIQPFAAFIRKPMTPEWLNRADAMLGQQVEQMQAEGLPTPFEILAHVMGITPAYAITAHKL